MGKPTNGSTKNKPSDTRILFRKSFNTVNTNSTCCSRTSQLVTKSGFPQITKNLQEDNFYSDSVKLKRDLSIETDACILRRYYKIKRQKTSNQGSSVVSKYSTVVDTEIETIEEFADTSACGDNEIMEVRSNRRIDIETLMVDNLKSLLDRWIQKKILYNKDTQNKLDTVLDSIIHKLDSKNIRGTSSDSTYVIDKSEQKQAVKNKKVATSSITYLFCKYCRGKVPTSSSTCRKDSSTITMPYKYKGIKIVSTLSVPRRFHKPELYQQKNGDGSHKFKKSKPKNIILSIERSNKLKKSSSFNLIAISTKSLTKRCEICNNIIKKRHVVLLPKPTHKNSTNSTYTTKQENLKGSMIQANKNELDCMPSLLRSLYTNSVDKNVQIDTKTDNFTMTENVFEKNLKQNVSQLTVQKDFSQEIYKENNVERKNSASSCIKRNKTLHFLNLNTYNKTKLTNNYKHSFPRRKNKKRKRHMNSHTLTNSTKSNTGESKIFTDLYKNSNKPLHGRDFIKYCQNICQYFSEQDRNSNITVDVRINVFPAIEPKTKDVCTDVSNQALDTYDTNGISNLLYNENNIGSINTDSQPYTQPATTLNIENERDPTISPSQCTAEIIPILDTADSQDKYIFNVNSREKTAVKSDVITTDIITSQQGILQELNELRAVIKDLAMTAERFVNEHIKKAAPKCNAETFVALEMNDNNALNSLCENNKKNISKMTQVSINLEKNESLSANVKEAKKKDTFDYYNRLTKKSTSYRIIESESLLKVTDMTSKANEANEYKRRFIDEALTCSLPKSRSLFEMTSDRNKKLIAFFCENPKVNCKARNSRVSAPSACKSSKTSVKSKKWQFWSKKDTCKSNCPRESGGESPSRVPLPNSCPEDGYSSTLSSNSTHSIIEDNDEFVRKLEHGGMSFGEGCVYCLLLWIPIIIILIVFYSYVLKDGSEPSNTTNITSPNLNNTGGREAIPEVLRINLSDLGF